MIIKCKMCGGDLSITEDSTVCECEYCGSKQTIPTADSEKKANLFNRANRLRMNAEFDKAASVYESIVSEFPEEAEAYWGLCLCTYGIEYVDDPATGEKKPTCHRTMPTSIMEDSNFEQACDCADAIARRIYRDEAKAIDRIQKDILQIVGNEKPYDVFICYKETAEEGGRTEDSVLAQEIYDSLIAKGLKVFFARISLEDKLGQQYEPYIYAALSSAKVMLAVGTRFEYYDAVWVKNEWMRFLSMMRTDKTKTLIPCYKGLDAYDMPKEFKQLQAQDMGKLGWLQDLTRGVMKLCGKNEVPVATSYNYGPRNEADSLLRRAELFLQDQEWDKADEYVDRVLDKDPENALAYFLRVLIRNKCTDESGANINSETLDGDKDYQKAVRFSDSQLRKRLDAFSLKSNRITLIQLLNIRAESLRLLDEKIDSICKQAVSILNRSSHTLDEIINIRKELLNILSYPKVKELKARCEADAVDLLHKEINKAKTIEAVRTVKQNAKRIHLYEGYDQLWEECLEKEKQVKTEDMLRMKREADDLANWQADRRRHIIQAQERITTIRKEYAERRATYRDVEAKRASVNQTVQNARNERNHAAAEVKRLYGELNNLHGLFSGKKRAEIEAMLQKARARLQVEEANCAKAETEADSIISQLPKQPEALAEQVEINDVLRDEGLAPAWTQFLQNSGSVDDCTSLLNNWDFKLCAYSSLMTAGCTMALGTYPLNDDGSVTAPILWKVLEVDRNKKRILLLSRYGLDTHPYQIEPKKTTWENSDLRVWLNKDFLKESFTTEEQAAILPSRVDNSLAQGREDGLDGGTDTTDKVFLLSCAEVEQFYPNFKTRACGLTDYAISRRAHADSKNAVDGRDTAVWWLRSPGKREEHMSVIWDVSMLEEDILTEYAAIRPAIWIDLSADIF